MTCLRTVALALACLTGIGWAAEAPPVKSEWLPGTYEAWSLGKRHTLIAREDGVTEFRHEGKVDWALNAFPHHHYHHHWRLPHRDC